MPAEPVGGEAARQTVETLCTVSGTLALADSPASPQTYSEVRLCLAGAAVFQDCISIVQFTLSEASVFATNHSTGTNSAVYTNCSQISVEYTGADIPNRVHCVCVHCSTPKLISEKI